MAEERQSFRFRLPWRQSAPAPRRPPRSPPSPSPAESPADPTQQPTTATTPAQRPSFRRRGITPPQLNPPTQAATTRSRRSRVTPQPVSPSSSTSQAPSPAPVEKESRSSAQPPIPSRASPQHQAETQQALQEAAQSQSPSPARLAMDSTSSAQPPSPSRASSQPQAEIQQALQEAPQLQSPPREVVTQPPLPSENLQPTTQSPMTFEPSSTEHALSESTEEPKSATGSQGLKLTAEITSGDVLNAQNQTQSQMTFQPNEMPAEPSETSVSQTSSTPTSTSAVDTPVLTHKSDSSQVNAKTKSIQEPDGNPELTVEEKEILQEHGSKEKINGVTEIPTAAQGSEVPNQMHPTVAFDAEQNQLEEKKAISKKETISNSSSQGNDSTLILHMEKTKVSESANKPNIVNGEKVTMHKEIRDDISKFVHKATHQQKHPLHERPVSVITLAGENRGSSMQQQSKSAREGIIHIHRRYKINPDESTTDGETNNSEGRSHDSKTGEDQKSKAYINSNVQGVNNSIMINSSITERDPGIQMVLSSNLEEPSNPNTSMKSLQTRKAEVNVTPAQQLTYEPTVRIRCLRGLFMESSDSDLDNPKKPRRHGCRYGCKEKSKDNEIDVL